MKKIYPILLTISIVFFVGCGGSGGSSSSENKKEASTQTITPPPMPTSQVLNTPPLPDVLN